MANRRRKSARVNVELKISAELYDLLVAFVGADEQLNSVNQAAEAIFAEKLMPAQSSAGAKPKAQSKKTKRVSPPAESSAAPLDEFLPAGVDPFSPPSMHDWHKNPVDFSLIKERSEKAPELRYLLGEAPY
ncbi:MAG: hypothetical protein HRU19_05455 [Pseudobacteriovorax sp.]|nr:hypothetical protein [Pseudobacteriovorax sp.]